MKNLINTKNKKIILASHSPRRQELLSALGLNFEIIVPRLPEFSTLHKPSAIVKELAFNKALEIKNKIKSKVVIIAADTLVYCRKELIGKPKTYNDAKCILKLLTANPQYVYSGFCIWDLYDKQVFKGYDRTKVLMNAIPEDILDKVIRENMDKAGCYAIQSEDKLVKKIQGDYYNVVGLPLKKVSSILAKVLS
ncbi:MAG: septum formation protein Maf [Bacteroidetes bacterium]|nr:septum formation protein Maf [Bacteroidota bacterium]